MSWLRTGHAMALSEHDGFSLVREPGDASAKPQLFGLAGYSMGYWGCCVDVLRPGDSMTDDELKRIGIVTAKTGHVEEAQGLLAHVVRRRPGSAGAHWWLSQCLADPARREFYVSYALSRQTFGRVSG
jgi:hypothetical protein